MKQPLTSIISGWNTLQLFNKNLYEGIGKELNTLGEFNQVQKSLGSNPAAQGSIGNGYAQKNLINGETVKEFGYSSELWTGKKATNRRADNLLINGQTTLDIKTGYPKGYPNGKEIEQLLDYNNAVVASRDPLNTKFRDYLKANGVQSGELKSHDYLFISNGQTNAKDVAIKSFGKIESKLNERYRKNIRVFYQGNDGNVYQVIRNEDKQIRTKLIGGKLPN